MPITPSATALNSVRAALDSSLDATALPDATILLPIYWNAAKAEVIQRDPLADTRTGDGETHVTNATILLAAARIAPALPSIVGEQVGDVRLQRAAVDASKRPAELRRMADAELNMVLESDTTTTAARPTMFAVATARRGR